ncbi:hypothetical protein MSG28_000271 [Choristoneura fumiferana]|uniref:Uncharacterized protein n=1 Tax=Choristoneura fumiferana TaxID=7141 RepID=A0ACC0K008_CHOFU|nr:hypothetical protein MSG28_000271 [Choristoneura fumiferana]
MNWGTELWSSPLLDIGLFHGAPQHYVFSPSQPSAASDPLKVVRPPCLRTPYATFSRLWSPFVNSSAPPHQSCDRRGQPNAISAN